MSPDELLVHSNTTDADAILKYSEDILNKYKNDPFVQAQEDEKSQLSQNIRQQLEDA